MGVAWCLLALQHQIIPPCVGLQDPEFDLNFATVPQPTRLRHALCLSFGFGGQNTALVIAAA
jgi:3-oxoacyl-[acyl-carrier-protein] synthase II